VSWIDDPALLRIWQILRRRLEERGLRTDGHVVLSGLDRAERHAVAGLLGRPVTGSRCRVDLAALDADLGARSGVGGLVAVLERATGDALRDRPGERARRDADRDAPFALARTLLPEVPWREDWLDGVHRSGLLRRTADPETAVRRAAAVLARLAGTSGPASPGLRPGEPAEVRARTDLAAAVGAGAHGLDDGRTLSALVLRALAARRGEPPPTTAAARRELWDAEGVRVDTVSSTCLTLGLHATGPASAVARLATAAEAGDPVHLTAWDLRRCTLVAPTQVLVTENPRVLEAVAERHGAHHPVVCTSGRPTLVVLDVLHAVARARLHYHGDFDWPGVAIANRLVADVGVRPWCMTADDYLAGLPIGGEPLAGAPVEPAWDADLGAAMRHHGIAVHEEAVLPALLAAIERADVGG
jgi:uncharacterized protein (TIGR02679 family)